MSERMRPIIRISSCALPLVLALAVVPQVAYSQSSVCYSIRARETAAQLARRLTGDARNEYQPWFQIVDSSSRSVPKSQYDRIRRGWSACIVKETSQVSVQPVSQIELARVPDPPAASPQPAPTAATSMAVETAASNVLRVFDPIDFRVLDRIDVTWVWLGFTLIVPWFTWRILDHYVGRRSTLVVVMRHFAHRFVSEFERPLIQQPAERPVRSRVRLSPARAKLEILLAPGQGRRYPNLSDHKKNVEYDVVRILRRLADDSFVSGPLYTQAGWVVVPFRFKVGQKHTGVT
jgi:hypothetical protein